MAARLRAKHQDEVRAKIQATQLINVLQNHALGLNDKDLPASRLKAIEILLRKSVADLQSVQLTGDEEQPVQVKNIFGWDESK